jgi:prepilin-type N-terminal cleavage/methylation domain-containing protein
MKRQHHKSGFTLVELLVVIAIISLLSSVVLATTNLAGARARDTRRVEELRQINLALEQYYQDHGTYPGIYYCGSIYEWARSTDGDDPYEPDCVPYTPLNNQAQYGDLTSSWKFLAYALRPYIANLPLDPVNSTEHRYGYYTNMNSPYMNAQGQPVDRSSNEVPKGGMKYGAYSLWTVLEDPTNPLRCGLKQYTWKDGIDLWGETPACPDGDDGSAQSLLYMDH